MVNLEFCALPIIRSMWFCPQCVSAHTLCGKGRPVAESYRFELNECVIFVPRAEYYYIHQPASNRSVVEDAYHLLQAFNLVRSVFLC